MIAENENEILIDFKEVEQKAIMYNTL